jgi:hypothetical protein
VPELARHFLVLLVEGLAVVGELAAPHFPSAAEANLPEPVGVREALAGRTVSSSNAHSVRLEKHKLAGVVVHLRMSGEVRRGPVNDEWEDLRGDFATEG